MNKYEYEWKIKSSHSGTVIIIHVAVGVSRINVVRQREISINNKQLYQSIMYAIYHIHSLQCTKKYFI